MIRLRAPAVCLSLLALFILAAIACTRTRGDETPASSSEATAVPAPSVVEAEPVETAAVIRGSLEATVTVSGSVVAPRETALGPEIAGRLDRVFVDVGDTVKRADPVFRIDPDPYRVAVEEARAGLALARAELAQATQEMERIRRLAAQRIVPQQELETHVTRHAVQEAKVSQAQARLHRAEQDLERTLVRAPYASSVVERHLHEGAMLQPGTVVVTLQQLGGFEAVLDVPEAARIEVREGDPLALFVEGVPQPIVSRVRSVNARIDAESRTYEVRAAVQAPPGQVVKAGAFVRGEVSPAPRGSSLLVDRDAILARDGRFYAFVRRGGVVARVPLLLGGVGSRRAEVVGGLSEGDEVVVGDVIERLADGARIEVERRRAARPLGETP